MFLLKTLQKVKKPPKKSEKQHFLALFWQKNAKIEVCTDTDEIIFVFVEVSSQYAQLLITKGFNC